MTHIRVREQIGGLRAHLHCYTIQLRVMGQLHFLYKMSVVSEKFSFQQTWNSKTLSQLIRLPSSILFINLPFLCEGIEVDFLILYNIHGNLLSTTNRQLLLFNPLPPPSTLSRHNVYCNWLGEQFTVVEIGTVNGVFCSLSIPQGEHSINNVNYPVKGCGWAPDSIL